MLSKHISTIFEYKSIIIRIGSEVLLNLSMFEGNRFRTLTITIMIHTHLNETHEFTSLVLMELQLECPSWVRVALATFPPITVRARMESLVRISLGLPPRIPTNIKKKKKWIHKSQTSLTSNESTRLVFRQLFLFSSGFCDLTGDGDCNNRCTK